MEGESAPPATELCRGGARERSCLSHVLFHLSISSISNMVTPHRTQIQPTSWIARQHTKSPSVRADQSPANVCRVALHVCSATQTFMRSWCSLRWPPCRTGLLSHGGSLSSRASFSV